MKKAFCILYLTVLAFNNAIAQNTQLQPAHNKENLFDHGLELLALESYDAAHIIFSKYLNLHPSELKSIDAAYYQAFCKLRMNNPQGEIQIRNFVAAHPNHPKAVFANYDLGTYYFSVKNYPNAIEHLSLVNLTLLDEKNRLECNFKLGYAYMNVKDFDKAGLVFQRIRSTKNKYTYAANYYLGYVNYKNGLYDLAELSLKKSAENAAYKSLVPQVMVNVYSRQKRYDTLIAYSKRILTSQESVKNVEEVYIYTAEAYYQKKDYTNAIVYFDKFLAANGKMNDGAKFRYGFSLYKTAKYELAVEQLKVIAEQYDSTGQSAGYYLGLAWLKTDNKAFAWNAFSQARKMAFNTNISAQATIEYGKLGIELQKFTEVIEAMKEFLKRFSEGAEVEIANGLLSEAYLHTNDYMAALTHIESVKVKSATLNKTYQQIAFYRAVELFNEEKYLEAIVLFEKSLLHDIEKETTVQTYFWLAEAYSTQKKYDEAITNYLKLIRSSFRATPDITAKNYYGLGYAYFNKQEYGKAMLNFKNYLEETKRTLNKEFTCDAYVRLADCFYALKKYDDAQLTYQKVIELQCGNLDYAYLQRGINQALNNKEEDAKRTLSNVKTDSKLYYDAVYNIGLIDFENTKYAASIPAFSKIINDRNSDIYIPLSLQKRAVAYNNLKQYQKSADDYQTVLSEFPKSKVTSNALVGLQDALSRLGKSELMDSVIQNYKAINPKDAQIEKLEFEKAKAWYFDQNYPLAIKNFEKFLVEYSKSGFSADAKYYLGDAYWKTKNYNSAKETFDEVIQEHPKSTFYNRSLQKMAEISFEDKEYSDAIINYNLLTQVSTNQKELSNAWNGLMISHFEVKNYDSTSLFAKLILEKGKISIIMGNRAALYLAKSALEQDAKNAQDLLINCFNTAQDISGAEAMYLYAKELSEEKNYKLSLEVLFDMANRFVSYEKWIGDAFMLIAENYISLGETYQAKATLASIVEKSKDAALVEKAKARLGEISEN